MSKSCSKCATDKPETEFFRDGRRKSGLTPWCKTCLSIAREERAERRKDPLQTPEALVECAAAETTKERPKAKREPKEPQSRAPDRYQVVRRVSRRTGAASWTIFDNSACEGANSVIYVADCLKDALVEKERLDAPPQKWTYKCRTGQIGVIVND